MKKRNFRHVLSLLVCAIALPAIGGGNSLYASELDSKITKEVTQSDKIKVRGVVQDTTGEAVIGATIVLVQDGTKGTVTNMDGAFQLDGVPADGTLRISYVGMKTLDVPINGQTDLSIVLHDDQELLDELVVVGYGTQKKANLSGAVATVSGKTLENRPITNVGQGLQGVVPNLNVSMNSGGAPGSHSSFNIRGNTSLNGGGPLVLVDNVQMDPNLVNPEDIESISVLKDAASASIYGARAAYGVILITTKKGKQQEKPVITASVTGYWQKPAMEFHNINSMDFLKMKDEASKNDGGGRVYHESVYEYAKKYFEGTYDKPVFVNPHSSTPHKYEYCGNTDWWNELYKTSFSKIITAGITGGTSKMNYYASLGLNDQGGILKHADDKYRKMNANINVSSQITDWLNISGKITNAYTSEQHPSGGATSMNPTAYSGISPSSGMLKADLSPLMPVYHPDGHYAGQGGYTNPVAVMREGGNSIFKTNDLWISGAVRLTPIEGLVINADYTWNYYNRNTNEHVRRFNEYTAVPGTEQPYPWTKNNSAVVANNNDYYHAFNAFAEYTKTFAEKHNTKVMVGYNFEKKENSNSMAGRLGLVDNDKPIIDLAYGDQKTTGNESGWAVQGLFGRINYDFMGKYLLEVNGRIDGSSKFPKAGRYAFFPSFSGAWRVSEESFWSEGLREYFNDLKLRASYGTLGNQNVVGDFPYLANYGINTQYDILFGGQRPVAVSRPGLVSAYFTWEKVSQINLGVDAHFFNSRLITGFDIYQRATKDMLTSGKPLPSVLGAGVPRENAADMKTYGWELSMEWNDRLSSGFNYHVKAVLADYQSVITRFDNPNGLLGQHYVGEKLGEIWGFVSNGLFQTEEEVKNHADQSRLATVKWAPGDIKYEDLDGNKKVDFGDNTLSNPGDRKIIGNSTPRYTFGLTLGADYKGIDAEIFIQGVGKRTFMPGGPNFWGFTDPWQTPLTTSLDYWTEDNRNAYFPRPHLDYQTWPGSRQTSTRYLQNAAYARLKNVTIGYTLPKEVNSMLGITNMRLYIQGENLLTLTPMIKAFDPEVLNNMVYPINKKIAIGLSLTI